MTGRITTNALFSLDVLDLQWGPRPCRGAVRHCDSVGARAGGTGAAGGGPRSGASGRGERCSGGAGGGRGTYKPLHCAGNYLLVTSPSNHPHVGVSFGTCSNNACV